MPRKRKPQETLLPEGRSAERRRHELYAPVVAAAAEDARSVTKEVLADINAHPDTAALRCLEAALRTAHLDPSMAAAPEVSRFVFLIRELVADIPPGLSLAQMLEPLQTVLARRGGGRPKTIDTYRRWLSEFDRRRALQRLTPLEIYEDIAAAESERTGKPVPWTLIRDGVNRARDMSTAGKG